MARNATASLTVKLNEWITVPVKAYTSVKENDSQTGRNIVHTACKTKIKQHNHCPKCDNKVLEKEDVTKMFEASKGNFVVMSDEDIKALKGGEKQVFNVTQVVSPIAAVYFDTTYDLTADKGGDKAFQLLTATLDRTGKMALGTVMFKDREQYACLHVIRGTLFLTTLHYGNEVRAPLDQPLPQVEAKSLTMMTAILEQLEGDFNPDTQVDTYTTKFLELAERKLADPTAVVSVTSTAAVAAMDLETALNKSLERAKAAQPKTKRRVVAKVG